MSAFPTSAIAVSNYFVDCAGRDPGARALDQLKLQKLGYYAYGWYAANQHKPLFEDDIKAWKLGPVIETVYGRFKRFGRGTITEREYDVSFEGGKAVWTMPTVQDDALQRYLDKVWNVYRDLSGVQLSNMSHEAGGPWDTVWRASSGSGDQLIPYELISSYFAEKLQAHKEPPLVP
ncbi:MAG: DUF4065 domain-containing protein [Oceanicaulis sp.]